MRASALTADLYRKAFSYEAPISIRPKHWEVNGCCGAHAWCPARFPRPCSVSMMMVVIRVIGTRNLAVKGICLAFGAFHLQHRVLDAQMLQVVLDFLPDGVGLAYLSIAAEDVSRKGGNAVADGPHMDIVDPKDVLHAANHL